MANDDALADRVTGGPMKSMVVVLLVAALIGGCGDSGEQEPSDEQAITTVMIENETGGPDRCTRIYTDRYLKLNWPKTVTSVPGGTPLEKCKNDLPPAGVIDDRIKVEVKSVDGDTAIATAKVAAYQPIGFALVRDPGTGGWQIDDFSD